MTQRTGPHNSKHAVTLCLAVFSQCCLAIELTPQFDIGIRNFDYQERDEASTKLNSESGVLHGFSARLDTQVNSLSFEFEGQYLQGTVEYDGQTQTGAPHSTASETRLMAVNLLAKYQLPDSNSKITIGLGNNTWNRHIQAKNGVAALEEDYQWLRFCTGVLLNLMETSKEHMELQLSLGRITNAHVEVQLDDFGLGTPVLKLPSRPFYQLGIRYERQLLKEWSFKAQLDWERFEFGRSNPKAISNGTNIFTIQEPGSETNYLTLTFGLGF